MQDKRIKSIFRTSVIAIIVNIALAIFKVIVGFISHSVAVTMDAINNFTDAGSSFITILAAYFASKDADKKHPFGYGRTEYLGTLLIGGLILWAGVTAFSESVSAILNPEAAEYSTLTLTIIIVAVVIKVLLALFLISSGKKTGSDSLLASGKEAIGDIAISIATVIAAFIFIYFNISIEAWLGVFIALFIIKSAIEILGETVSKLLGEPGSAALVRDIKSAIASHEHVKGAYDLVIHDYGPDSYIASVHIAVEDTLSATAIDELTREIHQDISDKFAVNLSAIGIYCENTIDSDVIELRSKINSLVLKNEYVHQMHGFYLNRQKKDMRFDLVISFDAKSRRDEYNKVYNELKASYPDYTFTIGIDADFNELD